MRIGFSALIMFLCVGCTVSPTEPTAIEANPSNTVTPLVQPVEDTAIPEPEATPAISISTPTTEYTPTEQGPLSQVQFAYHFDETHRNPSFVISPNGSLIAIARLATIDIYDFKTGVPLFELEKPLTFEAGPTATSVLRFSNDGSLLASGELDLNSLSPVVYIWDISSRALLHELQIYNAIPDLEFTPDDKLIFAVNGGEIGLLSAFTIIEVDTGQWGAGLLGEFEIANVEDVTFSKAQSLYATAETAPPEGGPAVRLARFGTEEIQHLFVQPPLENAFFSGFATSVAFSEDGGLLAAIVNDELRLWNLEINQEVQWPLEDEIRDLLGYETMPLSRVIFSSRDHLATLNSACEITLFKFTIDDAEVIDQFCVSETKDIQFSPDGMHLITGGGPNPIQVWQMP